MAQAMTQNRFPSGSASTTKSASSGGLEIRSFRESGENWPPELPTWNEEPEVLTASTLRKLPIGAILQDLREAGFDRMGEFVDWLDQQPEAEAREMATELQRSARRNRSPRPRGIAPLDQVAAVYKQAQQRRDSPTTAVEAHWRVAYSTAAKWVMKARQEGHLPPAKVSKAKR